MTTAGPQSPDTAPCPNCGRPVRPNIDWWCPNSACGARLFWQRGEHPDESRAGTMRLSTKPEEPAADGTPDKPEASAGTEPDRDADQPTDETVERRLERLRPPTITCWNCHARNSADRTHCFNCARRLRRTPATALLAAFPWLPERYLSRGTLIGGLMAALLILAGLLSLNALLDDGPVKGSAPTAPPARGTTPSQLPVASASATSVWSQDQRFGAQAVLDNNAATAWISASGMPVGESLTLTLPRAAVVTEIGIANGYQRSGRFSAYGRASRVLISFDDASSEEKTLRDQQGLQVLQMDQRTPRATRTVLIQVTSVQPSQASNVAISTVVLRGRTG